MADNVDERICFKEAEENEVRLLGTGEDPFYGTQEIVQQDGGWICSLISSIVPKSDPNTGESIPTRNLDEGAQCGLRETRNRRQDSE